MKRLSARSALCLALAAAFGLAACEGCHAPTPSTAEAEVPKKPSLRLYVLSTVAGALEPCGCTKDQLGGVDHLAAYLASQKSAAPDALVLGAGPMMFMDPSLKSDEATQSTWKAEALAAAAKRLGLTAWAPGANDWAAGKDELAKLGGASGAAILAANVDGAPGSASTKVVVVNGVKVGIVGVADPRDRLGKYPDGVKVAKPPEQAMREGIANVKADGARVLVGLAALPRGQALRVADAVPELDVLVVGKPVELGDANDAPKAPELVGSTLVVEAANHLQSVAVVDLFVRDAAGSGPIAFADGGGVKKADQLLSLSGRIRDLEARINSWEREKNVPASDVAARKADLAKLRDEKAKLEGAAAPPKTGSFFLYSLVEVRNELGSDPAISSALTDYYKRVNDHNKVAFADRKPPPVEDGKASYIGVDACSACHEAPRKVWDGTMHSHAYATLQASYKEYNLDCVSCHVTGYGKPGGSTVTWNDKLQNVGCEECHGPGSLHAKDPKAKGLIDPSPDLSGCVSKCHHSPHVENFDPAEKLKQILGPGHGM